MTSPPDISRSERIGLHPLALILALITFGRLFGILTALQASAALQVGVRELRALHLANYFFQDR